MNNLALLKLLRPDFDKIEEAALTVGDATVGWTSVFLDRSQRAMGRGVHRDRNTAVQIGLAETLERALVNSICDQLLVDELMLDQMPTTCGFALGFNEALTKQRSICEATERWAISKWLDDGYRLEEWSELPYSSLADFLKSEFDSVVLYSKLLSGILTEPVRLVVAVGFKGSGAFLGSRVGFDDLDCLEHSLSELWRHYFNFKNRDESKKSELIRGRIYYFGENRDEAIRTIERAKYVDWPALEFHFSKSIFTPFSGVFLYRSLARDYVGWHLGGQHRFIY